MAGQNLVPGDRFTFCADGVEGRIGYGIAFRHNVAFIIAGECECYEFVPEDAVRISDVSTIPANVARVLDHAALAYVMTG